MLMLALPPSLFAQTTKVSGKIVDAITREPLPFVNVLLKGTKAAGASYIEGNYTVSTSEKCDSIIISFVGYNRVVRAIKYGATQVINIGLTQGVDLVTANQAIHTGKRNRIAARNQIARTVGSHRPGQRWRE